jgi:hypothetical protein
MNMCVCERERNGREGGNALMHGWTANTETKREVFHVVCPTKDKKNSSTSQKPASIRVNRKKAASKFKNKQESVMKFNQMRKNKKKIKKQLHWTARPFRTETTSHFNEMKNNNNNLTFDEDLRFAQKQTSSPFPLVHFFFWVAFTPT